MLDLIISRDMCLILDVIIVSYGPRLLVSRRLSTSLSDRILLLRSFHPVRLSTASYLTLTTHDTQGGCNAKRKRLLRRMETPKAQHSELSDHSSLTITYMYTSISPPLLTISKINPERFRLYNSNSVVSTKISIDKLYLLFLFE